MSQGRRFKLLINNYAEAITEGKYSNYSIRQVAPDNFEHYYILIEPQCGVYTGHKYILELFTKFGKEPSTYEFPVHAPFIKFITKIFHTNVADTSGIICLDILKDATKWSAMNSVNTVIQNILQLLNDPNTSSSFNITAGSLWSTCTKVFDSKNSKLLSVKEMEDIHAECYLPFKVQAEKIMNANNHLSFAKWFPHLDKSNSNYTKWDTEYKNELAEIIATANSLKPQIKPVVIKACDITTEVPNGADLHTNTKNNAINESNNSDESKVESINTVALTSAKKQTTTRWAKYTKKD